MTLVKLLDYLRSRLKTLVRLSIALLVLLVLADALFVNKHEAHTSPEHIPGFWAVFGFVACVLIIVVSKWFGHAFVMKREDYYGE